MKASKIIGAKFFVLSVECVDYGQKRVGSASQAGINHLRRRQNTTSVNGRGAHEDVHRVLGPRVNVQHVLVLAHAHPVTATQSRHRRQGKSTVKDGIRNVTIKG